ncbi:MULTISPECIES: hypothetical protein [Actinomycetes]|uniref:hypothetical protein n=1 Tax=Actinomycetes TaxID=1760 RepID=UPI0033D8C7B3
MTLPPEDPQSRAGRFSLQAATEAALASTGPGTLVILLAVAELPPGLALGMSLAMVLGLRLVLLPTSAWARVWGRLRR